jgi:hypothetical protein
MIQAVTQSRWQEAQAAEVAVVSYDREKSCRAYQHIFDYLGMPEDQSGKFITEIGCGAYPAIQFCSGGQGVVYEPLHFDSLSNLAQAQKIVWYQRAFEDTPYPPKSDEVWIFNCLQHVRDPELVVTKAKRCAPVVRFFEPVDYPTCIYHPHTFTEDDFRRWFGEVKRYTDRLPGFFDADCVYGTWAI